MGLRFHESWRSATENPNVGILQPEVILVPPETVLASISAVESEGIVMLHVYAQNPASWQTLPREVES